MNNREYNKWYLVIAVFAIIFTFFGGSLAYWQWTTNTSERTNIALTVKEDFRCDADGGGDITSGEKYLVPTDCTNSEYAIQRIVTVKPTLFTNQLGVDLDLWLTINNIGTGLRNSSNFKYALTKSSTSCTSDVVASGTFKSKSNGSTVALLDKGYNDTVTETYYLYIWLDKAETSTATMDQDFSISLGGECVSTTEIKPEAPVLDDGMIPIKLSSTGVATTVSPTDDTWYNYENKEWANVVLVDSDSRSTYLNTTGKTVNEDDILAYYVWIPRYKYRITGKCLDINNPTIENNPECYAPYRMSETDKTSFVSFIQMMVVSEFGITDFTIAQAKYILDEGLRTGIFKLDSVAMNISDVIELYNSNMGVNVEIIPSSFNSGNKTIGPSLIDISFETTTSSISNGNAIETYKTHPAFIWDGETVGGIWVGKFETTGDATTPTIKPNLQSLRSQNVSTQFTSSLKFAGGSMNTSNGMVTFAGSNTYGLTNQTDSHMMKNSEWGVVAYLSHSKYGINEKIYMNNSENFYTGRSGGNVSGNTDISSYGTYTWTGQLIDSNGTIGAITDSTLGTKASTTGNVTGVYDMSGGTLEYVMGVLSDSNGKPRSGYSSRDNSGFNGTVDKIFVGDTSYTYTSGISFPNSKYYDLYLESRFNGDTGINVRLCNLETCGGHALNETLRWYDYSAFFVELDSPWFVRSAYFSGGIVASIFLSSSETGGGGDNLSWRSVLVVGE